MRNIFPKNIYIHLLKKNNCSEFNNTSFRVTAIPPLYPACSHSSRPRWLPEGCSISHEDCMACDQCSHPVRPNLLERTAQVSFEFLPPRISLLSDVLYLLAKKKNFKNTETPSARNTVGLMDSADLVLISFTL